MTSRRFVGLTFVCFLLFAVALLAGGFGNKNSPPRFNANRPFAYVIIDNVTKVVLFVGQNTLPR